MRLAEIAKVDRYAPNETAAAAMRAKFPGDNIVVGKPPRKRSSAPGADRAAQKARNAADREANERVQRIAAEQARKEKFDALNNQRKPSPLFRLNDRVPSGSHGKVGLALIAAGAAGGTTAGRALPADRDRRKPKKVARDAAIGGAAAYGGYWGGGNALSQATRTMSRRDPVSNKLAGMHAERLGLPKGKLAGSTASRAAINGYYRSMPHGVRGAGLTRLLARTHGVSRTGRMAVPVIAAGAAAGATQRMFRRMPNEDTRTVGKADEAPYGEYPYLLANIQQDGVGVAMPRANPVSPLQMLSAANITGAGLAKIRSHNPFFRTRRTKAGVYQMSLGNTMAVQPLGYGVLG